MEWLKRRIYLFHFYTLSGCRFRHEERKESEHLSFDIVLHTFRIFTQILLVSSRGTFYTFRIFHRWMNNNYAFISSLLYFLGCCSNFEEREEFEQISTMCGRRHQTTGSRALHLCVPNKRSHQGKDFTALSTGKYDSEICIYMTKAKIQKFSFW